MSLFLKSVYFRKLFRVVCFLIALPMLGGFLFLLALTVRPLSPEKLQKTSPESRRIVDSSGILLREVANNDGALARWSSFEVISPLVVNATIAVEDSRYYSHSGVDAKGVLRAVKQNLLAGRVCSGASTITMQLSRLIFKHPHTMTGKIHQAFDAIRIERAVDKKTILVQYLNRASYGAGTVGIEAASHRYFGKPNVHLSLAEAALLAGLPRAPTKLNPLKNFPDAIERQRYILKRMYLTGRISKKSYERALKENVIVKAYYSKLAAMHFTEYVLSKKPEPGYVFTTLDGGLQKQIEGLVESHVAALESGGLTNASVVVLDNKDGAVLAMAGSTDYWNPDGGSVNGALALRQPGSTMKPFTYATAFEGSYSPASLVADIKTQYVGSKGTIMTPSNYSGRFYGPVLMREALGRSLNVPAIRTANAIGIENLLKSLQKTGFVSLNRTVDHYGLGLTLGSGEVTLLELAQGYAMFARRGLTCRVKIFKDMPEEEPVRVFSEDVCFLISDILSDEGLRIRAFGVANPLMFDFPIAIKTGTSSNWRDNWVVGYTEQHTIAVWAGDFKGNPMNQMSGSIGAGPLFNKIANLVVYRGAIPQLPVLHEAPEGVESILICKRSGMTPTELCPQLGTLYVLKKKMDMPPCDIHRKYLIDTRNGLLASDRCPSDYVEEKVFEILLPVYAEWQASMGIKPPPARYSPYCPDKGITANALVITRPRNGEVYLIEPGYDPKTQSLELCGEADLTVADITWMVNGKEIAKKQWPYNTAWPVVKGHHRIEMISGMVKSDPVEIEVR